MIATFGVSGFSLPVSDAQNAIAIADQVCGQSWDVKIDKWRARLDGDTWTVWTGKEGSDLMVFVPRNGPLPQDCDMEEFPGLARP